MSPETMVKSENMLGKLNYSQESLEGQSLGRHVDSEITDNQNAEGQDKQVTEEEMLDIAENFLRLLAEKLLENGWSVKDVFDHPKLVHMIASYEESENVKALSA